MATVIVKPQKNSVLSLLAGGCIAVFLLLILLESSIKSPVFDEPPHLASGLYYLEKGEFRANPQHPPLLKEMSAVALLLGGIHWPKTHGGEWSIGNSIIAENGPDRVMFWARLPFILVASLLGVLIYVWGRQMIGALAAVGAVFLYVLDPTVLAHSFLVTTDVGLAAFSVLFVFAIWNYVRRPTLNRLLLCGLAMGAVMGAKFSALFLVPVAPLLLAAAVFWPVEQGLGRKPTFLDPYWPSTRLPPERRVASCACAFLAMSVVALAVIQALYFSPNGPLLYLRGLRQVNADHVRGYQYFMAGKTAKHFWSYFAVAYLLKEPIASIILVGIGLVTLIRSRTITPIRKLFLVLPPAALFAGYTIFADACGFRYVIPVLPFAYLIGGLGLATLIRNGTKWGGCAAGVLCAWMILAAAGVYPDHLSYFNEAACLRTPSQIGVDGGTRCGPLWLDDSNVDWGQGLKQLRAWADRNAEGRVVRLADIGSFSPASTESSSALMRALYGLAYENIGLAELMRDDPAPGLYVVSAHLLARTLAYGGANAWVWRTRPVAIVGHSFYVYDIPPGFGSTGSPQNAAPVPVTQKVRGDSAMVRRTP